MCFVIGACLSRSDVRCALGLVNTHTLCVELGLNQSQTLDLLLSEALGDEC